MRHRWRLLVWAAGPALIVPLLAGCASSGASRAPAAAAEPAGPPVALERPPQLVVEAIVTDKKGVPVTTLRPSDFQVSVDGRRRLGLAVARLYRGPGAGALAESVTTTAPGETQPVAESSRVFLVVVDQPSLGPGDEVRARNAITAWLDTIGVADRVAVVALPLARGTTLAFERPAIRDTLASLRPLRSATADQLGAAEGEGAERQAERGAGERAGAAGREEALPKKVGGGEAAGIPEAAAEAHARSSVGGLAALLESLAQVPGGKTVLFLSAGVVTADARSDTALLAGLAARAHARVFSLLVPPGSQFSYGEVGEALPRSLAEETGGSLVRLSGAPQVVLERLTGQLSFSYLLMLAPMAGDESPEPHQVGVALAGRSNLVVSAPARVRPGRVTPDAIAASLSPRAVAAAPPPPGPARPPASDAPSGPPLPGTKPFAGSVPVTAPLRPAFNNDPALRPFIARVAEYVWEYGEQLSSVVSEETYLQEASAAASVSGKAVVLDGRTPGAQLAKTAKTSRTLVSDYLQVKIPGMEGWLPFRDVFEVDGEQIRDRQDRLVKLFVQSSPERALQNAQAIVQESARYNLGNVRRDLNVPTLTLWYLEPANTRRFNFRKAGEETLHGRRVWEIEYTETTRPTFVKTPFGDDIVSSGRIWAEPTTGRVHRTLVIASIAKITVDYGPRPELPGLWVPVSMEEEYRRGDVLITGRATYAKFRQFHVQTMEQIVLPKK